MSDHKPSMIFGFQDLSINGVMNIPAVTDMFLCAQACSDAMSLFFKCPIIHRHFLFSALCSIFSFGNSGCHIGIGIEPLEFDHKLYTVESTYDRLFIRHDKVPDV